MVFKALTSVFFLSLSLSFLQNAGVVVLLCLTAIALAARAIHARRSKIVLDVKLSAYRARLTTHADRDETFVAETLGRRAREEEVFLSRVSARFYGERKRPRRSREEWEESDKGEIDDGLDASGKRREIRDDSE